VFQDNFLFDGTIAENVAYADASATREEIVEVCRIANCHEFIEGFPNGYDTLVGERCQAFRGTAAADCDRPGTAG